MGVVGAFVACTASMAAAADTPVKKEGFGPYLSLYGGVAIPETLDNGTYSGRVGGLTLSSRPIGDLKLKTGSIFGAKVGLMGHSKDAVWRYFGMELDVSATSTAVKSQPLRIAGFNSLPIPETDLTFLTGALHFLAKVADGPVQPYIGIGPAVVHGKLDAIRTSALTVGDQSATALGLSAIAGMRVKLAEQFAAFLEYKHIRASMDFDHVSGDAVIHAGVGGFSVLF